MPDARPVAVDRSPDLLAAAGALRNWVSAQRAGWADGSTAVLPQVRFADPPPFAAPEPEWTEHDGWVTGEVEQAGQVGQVGPERPAGVPWEVYANRAWRIADAVAAFGGDVFNRSWKAVVASALVVALAWTGVTFGRGWAIRAKGSVAAGRQAIANGKSALLAPVTAGMRGRQPTASEPSPRTGRLQIESNPIGARVAVDGKDKGATPLTLDNLTPGQHLVVLRAAEGSVQRRISVVAGQTTKMNEAIFSGWLHISSPIELRLSEGSHGLTLDERNQVLLPPGRHDVQLENRALGFRERRRIDITPGDTTSITVEPAASFLSVTATEPAQVSIDGTVVGETPLADVALSLGTHDVLLQGASGAVRRVTITHGVHPSQIDVDFSKP